MVDVVVVVNACVYYHPSYRNRFPLPSLYPEPPMNEAFLVSMRQGCLPLPGFHLVSSYQGQLEDLFDAAPFSSAKAFAATSQRTFHGRHAMISVQVLGTTCCAPACGLGELLPTQLAIRVDNRDIEVASSAIRPQPQLNLDLDLCFLNARSAFGRSRYPPWTHTFFSSARPSRLVSGMTIPAARLPCWGRALGVAVLSQFV